VRTGEKTFQQGENLRAKKGREKRLLFVAIKQGRGGDERRARAHTENSQNAIVLEGEDRGGKGIQDPGKKKKNGHFSSGTKREEVYHRLGGKEEGQTCRN